MSAILVTGCAGFIGSHVCERLLQRGEVVVGIDEVNDHYDVRLKHNNIELLTRLGNKTYRRAQATPLSDSSPSPPWNDSDSRKEDPHDAGDASYPVQSHTHFHFYMSDIDNAHLLATIFLTFNITSVIHLAARAGVRPSLEHPHLYTHANITATLTLLQECVKERVSHSATQLPIRHFVYASSSSVYGDAGSNVSSTDTLCLLSTSYSHTIEGISNKVVEAPRVGFVESQNTDEPVSIYAASKKSCELLVSTFAHQYHMLSSGLRFFTVFGPRGRPDMFPLILLDSIVHGKTVKMFGDGTSSRDFTFISDICDGILGIHDKRIQANIAKPFAVSSSAESASSAIVMREHEVFNLGNSNPIQLCEYIKLVERIVGIPAKIQTVEQQAGDVQHTYADVSKAKRIADYEPKVSVEEGMRKTYEWYKNEYLPWLQTNEALVMPSGKHHRLLGSSADSTTLSVSVSFVNESAMTDGLLQQYPHSEAFNSYPSSPDSTHRIMELSPPWPIFARSEDAKLHVSTVRSMMMCTRIHVGQVLDPKKFLRSDAFVRNLRLWASVALCSASHVAIAVDCTDARTDIRDAVVDVLNTVYEGNRIQVVCVSPWNRFVPALNSLLQVATVHHDDTLYLTSLEVEARQSEITAMHHELIQQQVLVVGLRMQGHHWAFEVDEISSPSAVQENSPRAESVVLNGATVPWNTNAIWNVNMLRRTGFLSLSDDSVHGGVEEAAVIAMHSVLHVANGGIRKPLAILLDFEQGVSSTWNTKWSDEGRRAWHETKVASKVERAAWQLQQLAIDPQHIHVLHKRVL